MRISQIHRRARMTARSVRRMPSCAPRIMTVVMVPGPHMTGVPMMTPAMDFLPIRSLLSRFLWPAEEPPISRPRTICRPRIKRMIPPATLKLSSSIPSRSKRRLLNIKNVSMRMPATPVATNAWRIISAFWRSLVRLMNIETERRGSRIISRVNAADIMVTSSSSI
jgi:hypothetical protein